MFKFEVKKESGRARTGILHTPHGEIKTPGFVPVATKGALKGMGFERAKELGADVFMVNTFHFYCKKEYETVKKMGGLHKFLDVNFPLMTDSGGFQVFSLGFGYEHGVGKIAPNISEKDNKKKKNLVKIEENGAIFSSPFDGSKVEITPESSIDAQKKMGADIIFAFDECTSPLASYKYQKESLKRTHQWAERSLEALGKTRKQVMMGIVQGGKFEDLRRESARFIASLPFFGFGIGGSFGESFGDSKSSMSSVLETIFEELPKEKPRHLLGIGEPENLIESALRGVDLFDCVIPTRFARHGTALTRKGRINIKASCYREDKNPLDKSCSCNVCRRYKKSYLHHLVKNKEIYGIMLLTEHNLHFVLHLMEKIREAIEKGDSSELKKEYLSNPR